MTAIEQVLNSKKKPKEKVSEIVKLVASSKAPAKELIEYFKKCPDVEKGTLADVMKHVSAEKPEVLAPYAGDLIEYINYDAPRVRWGVPEAIGNLSKKFPKKVEKAVPRLLENAKDESTVIKWCAAYALSEIAKNNKKMRKQLVPKFNEIIKKEKNNGVKNVYLKAIKFIENQK